MKSTRKLRLVMIALALAVSAALVAVASHDTNAYFSDVHAGTMGGTLASAPATCSYRLEPGASKAEYWGSKGCQQARWLPIAAAQPGCGLRLDFGDAVRRQSTTWPDVLRLASLVSVPHAVSFSVSGPIAAFITGVHLQNGTSVLPGGATASVLISVSVPARARIGIYAGTLTVHVEGWSPDARLPLTITICANGPQEKPRPAPSCTTSTSPLPSPSCKPSTSPTPAKSPTPCTSAEPASSDAPVPLATPTGPSGATGV
jgi:hypothetical protein